ncbi:hypothetical protein [Stenotrophomonas sp.]|uniref:hypothetical protein n=1 Tax=Stenotrophomonas sp. TaxID=69392 RepID=UPI001310A86E|nr:hypothetical protein [Stenotrophomonas sp.]
MTWLYAIGLKIVFTPVIAFGYWLLAIKGSTWIGSLLPEGKWKEILTRERY